MLQLAIVNGQNNFFYNGQVVDINGDGILNIQDLVILVSIIFAGGDDEIPT